MRVAKNADSARTTMTMASEGGGGFVDARPSGLAVRVTQDVHSLNMSPPWTLRVRYPSSDTTHRTPAAR